MSVKFSRTGSPATQLSIADGAQLTFPNSDWAVGAVVVFDGDTTGYGATPQTVFSTGSVSTVGSLQCMWDPFDFATAGNQGRFHVELGGSSAVRSLSPVIEAGKAYVLVIQRASNALYTKLCPILTSSPADGSAVLSSAGYGISAAQDGAEGLIIGNRSLANRRFANSMARFFRIERALTDLEIAQLAYGKEITSITAPSIYIRLNDTTDTADTGTQANAVATQGAIANGTAPGFGFSSVPTSPSFGSKPALGNAVVSQPVEYTGGDATGNPTPSIVRQWTLDGTDISGATGATYTPVAGDINKALRLRLTAANGIAPAATTTSDPVTVSSTAVGITLISIPVEAIYQRMAGAAAVPFAGAYVGAQPAKVEAQIYDADGVTVVRSWFDVSATFGSGTWSASTSVAAPANGRKYRTVVRSLDGSGNTIASAAMSGRFGVGDRFLIIGSSSPATLSGAGSGSSRTPDHNVLSTSYDAATVGGTWTLFDSYGQSSLIAAYFAARTGVPTAIVNVALGGSALSEWADNASTRWARFTNALAFMGQKLAGVFGAAGSNDIINPSAAQTVEAHLTKLRTLAANIRTATGQAAIPIVWNGINRRYDALPLQANNARGAERAFGQDPNVYYIQILDIEVRSPDEGGDGIHPSSAGYDTTARRMEYVGYDAIFGGAYHQGSLITGITYSGTTVTVTIQHRNAGASNLSPESGATGFKVTDDSGPAPIVSTSKLDATRYLITCNRALANAKVTYLEGAWIDNAAPVFDNGSTPLPMMAEVALLASEAPTDNVAPVMTGNLTTSNVTQTGFTMSWGAATDNVGIDHYETSTNGGSSWSTAGTSLSRAVTGAAPGATFQLRVRAHDNAGNQSNLLSATVTTASASDTTAPVLTGQLAVSNITYNSADLAWPAASDNVGVTGYERSIDAGATWAAVGSMPAASLSGLAASATYQVRVRAYDAAGNRSAPLSRSFTTLAEQPPGQDDVDGSKIGEARKAVFPGGTRVVPFGTRPAGVVPNAPSYESGKWWCDKHPLDERFWVADMTVDLAEAGSAAVSVEPIVAGVTVLEQPVIQGALIPIKLGGLDLTSGAVNYCTFRVTCANGEQFDRTIWFRPQHGKWELLKDPEDKRFYVADIENDLVDSNTTATAATAIPVGVAELVAAQVQGSLIVVKLGGMDTSPDPTNYCTLRIDCANGERFYRTIHFTRVDN